MRILIFGKGGISAGIKEELSEHEVIELKHWAFDVRHSHKIMVALDLFSPDWIINCAGVSYPDHGETQFLGGNFGAEIETNLVGAFEIDRQAKEIPQIHIASVAGLYGKPGHAGYSASKAGVISMVQSLALEGKKIWAISPGRVDTPMREKDYPNDTPGSRLDPKFIGKIVRLIMDDYYEPGTNIVVRKKGLTNIIVEEHKGDGWREKLRVGEPVTI